MDVIVTWEDGSKNCVSTKDLRPIRKSERIKLGTKVKMLYKKKWYYGTVTVVENKKGLQFWSSSTPTTSKSQPCNESNMSNEAILSEKPQKCQEGCNFESSEGQKLEHNMEIDPKPELDENIIVSNFTLELINEGSDQNEEKPPTSDCCDVNEPDLSVRMDGTSKINSSPTLDRKNLTNNIDSTNLIINKTGSNDHLMINSVSDFDVSNTERQNQLTNSTVLVNQTETTVDNNFSNTTLRQESATEEIPKEIQPNSTSPSINTTLKLGDPPRLTDTNINIIIEPMCCDNSLNKKVLTGSIEDTDDHLISRIANTFIKSIDNGSSALQNTTHETSPGLNQDDALTYCPSNRTSPDIFGDFSDLNDPDYVPPFPSMSQEISTQCYVPQSCEVHNCDREVFSSCYLCAALLCWDHFDDGNLACCSINNMQPQKSKTADTDQQPQSCEVVDCNQDVFSSCFRCTALLCYMHFEIENPNCTGHIPRQEEPEVDNHDYANRTPREQHDLSDMYPLDGSHREFEIIKEKKINKRKLQKKLLNTGQEHLTVITKKVIPAKQVGLTCNLDYCKKMNRKCIEFSEEMRKEIHSEFYKLGDVNRQREFLARHIVSTSPKQRTTQSSRRTKSLHYYLTKDGKQIKVCRKFFLNTLSISEKKIRTCLDKIDNKTGVLETDRRGGRREMFATRDSQLRSIVENHIQRFPRIESHYCRSNTSREYLHPDLTKKKMHRLLLEEQPEYVPSLTFYKSVFKEMNLSFYHPKKDQCSLCATYKSGSVEVQEQLREKYTSHAIEKETVRAYKRQDKKRAEEDESFRCSCFDLQQVIFLPISNESAIFYKRRLSIYNLTMYDVASRHCVCFVWPETESKRGSSEISTAVVLYLEECDEKGVKEANLYADGCAGQNKNTIVASALLYFINRSKNMQTISLKFFTPNHGQNEGDSAHSAISYSLSKAGDLFVHSQLYPIIRMARPSQPYIVRPLEYKDFQNYKKLSKDLKILTLRKDNETQKPVNWTEIVEIKVEKKSSTTIFFKSSHADTEYRSITLKRTEAKHLSEEIEPLNETRIKIAKAKYQDLMSLCTGDNPIIRLEEYKSYYENLPHE